MPQQPWLLKQVHRAALAIAAALAVAVAAWSIPSYAVAAAERTAEKAAIASPAHPYAGFWKSDGACRDNFGLAIAPAGPDLYSVSFCGPGGCFKPGTYRPDTPLTGDANCHIISEQAIEVRTATGYT